MSSQYTPETFKVLLKKLVQTPDDFTPEDCAQCFRHLCVQGASEAQAGAFLTALTLSGLESSPDIVAACASVLREHAVSVTDLIPEGDGYAGLVDIVGTGGDGWDTYNVSTTAAVVVAGAGVRVAKHGSKAATSTSGSADLLLSLDCRLAFPVSEVHTFLEHSPFLFLFAPHYHPSLAHIAPIRRNLNFRTIFNVLGPLINPARPQRMLLGVAKQELGDTFAEVLRLLNVERALVVCGKEGLDEISPAGETWTWWLENGQITKGSIHPTEDFGLPLHSLSSVRGSTPDLNALTFQSIMSNSPAPPHLSSPASADSPSLDTIRDYVLLNAAALLHVSGKAKSWKEGVEIARETIESGGALAAFEGFRDASKKAMGEHVNEMAVEDDGGIAAKNGFVKAWLKERGRKRADSTRQE
ncbi:anthranilate phosphoribosyltransferase [Kwoniella mangroviensis CBS 10435]|uniref:Anthranilate phosphoribosyltransferase n=1 Tax=Kwoniella mangroviensis CBS 10435 TaxID=1331196 RepID=A0A1B9IGN8_9TREE|nr:anthranilate phosphoribosyltransferase [Kwoniella mangroviensis CBS 8507]OCF54693.1 anthranilate phosphoribosyltransferase [Kwoniella mangroviensis CBS 10435]OCF63810.1 anthranilate phosphoribosyltransferase [Kwoniella mangroviensis CBS 8507]OCF78679.1 anthranilate phosphoribosyltransferase [Kwoniella mangroviensis CBS 8886]